MEWSPGPTIQSLLAELGPLGLLERLDGESEQGEGTFEILRHGETPVDMLLAIPGSLVEGVEEQVWVLLDQLEGGRTVGCLRKDCMFLARGAGESVEPRVGHEFVFAASTNSTEVLGAVGGGGALGDLAGDAFPAEGRAGLGVHGTTKAGVLPSHEVAHRHLHAFDQGLRNPCDPSCRLVIHT